MGSHEFEFGVFTGYINGGYGRGTVHSNSPGQPPSMSFPIYHP